MRSIPQTMSDVRRQAHEAKLRHLQQFEEDAKNSARLKHAMQVDELFANNTEIGRVAIDR